MATDLAMAGKVFGALRVHELTQTSTPCSSAFVPRYASHCQTMMVASTGRLEAIRSMLAKMTLARLRRPVAFVEDRLSALRQETSEQLAAALRKLSPEATRKELHRLRLLVKSLRYKEEIALETAWADPHRMMALKRLQRTLGDYCDRDQFRRLARKMNLACRSEIKKEYRQYHEKARDAVRKLGPPEDLASGLR